MSSASSTPATTPTTGTGTSTGTTTTTTPTSVADSAEYKASAAAVASNTAYALDKGIDGKGVILADIDSGINMTSSEFAGRISPDSGGFDQKVARCATCATETVHYDANDATGHGTETAAIAAAARNSSGILGVAPGATILALNVSAPNLSGVTPTSGPILQADSPNTALIAPAISYAVAHGAFVISMSLNGQAGGQVAADQKAAMDGVRTSDRLLVESVSNVTGQDSFSGQIAQNLVGADLSNKANFLFAIRVDANLRAPSGNGVPGALADRTLAVVASNIQSIDKDGNPITVDGNSFAAPAVAGAAALLKQYWPTLGGATISKILLDTATDLGPAGVDQTFGVGLLNVQKAMTAQATTAAFSSAEHVLSGFSSLVISGAFGGSATATAIGAKVSHMTVFDVYGRDYRMAAPSGIKVRDSRLLAGAMLTPADPPWLAVSPTEQRLGMVQALAGPWQGTQPNRPAVASFSPAPGQLLTASANVAIGQGTGIAGSPLRAIASTPIGVSSSWTSFGWTGAFSAGSTRDGRMALRSASFSSPSGLGLEVSDLVERGQALGLRGDASLGLSGARTTMVTATAARTLAGVTLTGRATIARTRVDGDGDLLRFDRSLLATAFSAEAGHRLLGGLATLGLSSPLHVERAVAMVRVPVSYDLASGALVTATAPIDIAPSAREMDLELGWSMAFSPTSSIRLGVARAFAAGNVAGMSDTAGFVALVLR